MLYYNIEKERTWNMLFDEHLYWQNVHQMYLKIGAWLCMDCGAIIAACLTVGGTLLGVILTLVVQYLMEKWKMRTDKEREVLTLKINTYADAIRYISICARLNYCSNLDEQKKLSREEDRLYNQFHPIFTIIAPKDVINKFNDLRNEIDKKKITQEVAYEKVVQILDFNINSEKGRKL